VISKSLKQDIDYVLDSLNYVLSLQMFEAINTFYLCSDNATNFKNGYDFFNFFSTNGPFSEKNKKFVRLFTWYFILFYFILFYFILFYFILFYFILFCFVLFCFVFFYYIKFKLISYFSFY
jgi:fatty acid desaturase